MVDAGGSLTVNDLLTHSLKLHNSYAVLLESLSLNIFKRFFPRKDRGRNSKSEMKGEVQYPKTRAKNK